MTDLEMNRRVFLKGLLVSGAALVAGRAAADPVPEYPTAVPAIDADKVLSFTWDNVDKYPLTTSLEFIPAQNTVVTGGDDCQLAVWDLENGELLEHFPADDDWIRSLALASDGTLAALSHNGSIKLWDAAEWKQKKTLTKLPNGAESIAFSPDGRFLAVCGFENTITLFDPEAGRIKTELTMPGTGNTDVAFSPDGRFLAAAGRDGILRIWGTENFKQYRDFKVDGRRIRTLAFSMDGSLVAAGGDGLQIKVWDTASGETRQTVNIGIGKTFSLCFCGNDILASGDSLNSIRLWNIGDGTEFGRCLGHTGTVAAMLFNLDQGILLSGGFDTTVRSWPIMK